MSATSTDGRPATPPPLPAVADLIAMLGDEEPTSSVVLSRLREDQEGEEEQESGEEEGGGGVRTPAPDFGFALVETAAPFLVASEPAPDGTATLLRRADRRGEGDPSPDYVFCQVIGEGGHGRVWRALQTNLSREVALKTLLRGDTRSFLREAYTSAELDHPNILPIYDLGRIEEDGTPRLALAMKMVRGTPWNVLLDAERRDETFDGERFLTRHLLILLDVCKAVGYAHSKNILHRDLKPHQVMVGRFGEVYLMDWGMAMVLADDAPASHREGIARFNTRRNAKNQCGTPAYMAPEQTEEAIDLLGFHTDLYLLGAILFEIINAEPPHNAATAGEAWDAAARNALRPMHGGCPADLRAILDRALATDPRERYRSADEFREAIVGYLGGSTRRRESVDLGRAAIARLAELPASGPDEYAAMARIEEELERAITLWPENHEAAETLAVVRLRHARRALDHADLRLAQSLLAAIPGAHPEREQLARDLRGARVRQRRHHLQRRAATIASLLLLLALVALAVRHAAEQGYAQLSLEAERDHARRARDRAEDLVNYLLTDLRDGLEPLDRLDLLEEVSRRSLAYFDKLPRRDVSPRSTHQRAVALNLIGSVLLRRGQTGEAQQAFTEALALARGLVVRAPNDPPTLRLLAQCAAHIGDVKTARGEDDAALVRYGEARQIYRRLLAPVALEAIAEAERADLRADATDVLERLAGLHERLGDFPAADALRGEAADVRGGEVVASEAESAAVP